VYFIFFSDGGAPKRRGARSSLPLPYPTFYMSLIKMHNTHSWIKCVLSSSISYFVVCYFQRKIFTTKKLLHHTFCQIDNQKVSNLILIITM